MAVTEERWVVVCPVFVTEPRHSEDSARELARQIDSLLGCQGPHVVERYDPLTHRPGCVHEPYPDDESQTEQGTSPP